MIMSREIDEELPTHVPDDELEALKKVGMIEVLAYRHRDSVEKKPGKMSLTKTIKEVPEKAIKGQAISHSVE
jgi:hypothetical protein